MTLDMVRNLYRDILKQVLLLEIQKKETAKEILLRRSEQDRLPLIRDFLNADLSKHKLLEQAAVSAMQNQADEVLDHIGKLYSMAEGGSLIECVREEIAMNQRLLDPVSKEIKHPGSCDFFERRILREVNKYVTSQAREYAKTNF